MTDQYQRRGHLDAIVFGCGSSGTMTGLSRCFVRHSPATELILADPVGSILAQYIDDGMLSQKSASWMVESWQQRRKLRRALGIDLCT